MISNKDMAKHFKENMKEFHTQPLGRLLKSEISRLSKKQKQKSKNLSEKENQSKGLPCSKSNKKLISQKSSVSNISGQDQSNRTSTAHTLRSLNTISSELNIALGKKNSKSNKQTSIKVMKNSHSN